MLPSSYTRRLRTRDLIQRNFPDINRTTSKSSSKTFTRVGFADTKSTHAYLPFLLREKTKTHCASRVSGQINLVLERLSEIDKKHEEEEAVYKRKANAIFFKEKRDTPIPPQKLDKQHSRLSLSKNVGRLKPIKEKKEKEKPPPIIKDTVENLTRERMIVLARTLMKDKRMATCYKRNPNRIELMPPIVCDGTPAWSHEVRSDVIILVPIKSLRYTKWKYSSPEIGYIEIDLPKKNPRSKIDTYSPLRADDEIHLSSSKLNKALVEVFMEGLRLAKFGEYSLLPELNFDYLNDTLELVFTKHLRIPLVPAIFVSVDEPLYVIKPNLPDLDPTSDTLFRACFLAQEENILRKISITDHGLRVDALKVIHTLCKQDWRLQALTVYQLKNVLMHDIDFEVDHSPRWQRVTRDICVQSILKRLLYFVKKQNLPHFFQTDLNLLKRIPEKTLTFMQTPLKRLVSNEPQLLRDLQRASRTYEESDTSSESDEDWW
ncbi:uncharacterized protein LOC123529543 [Mercenaria mercenaria]|uniref:uncharacterized protein LOC123529543 n=1 Tax=Mercenaria mercenaria TaxID=6596 RepID=UPI00234F2944|nr:uncharacterized protein LOC123529543 [Mercenaria mercenaria]